MSSDDPSEGANVVIQVASSETSMPVRIAWFLFVGWWLSAIVILGIWLLSALIITLPLALTLLNKVPQITTLRKPSTSWSTSTENGTTIVREVDVEQREFWKRALYFVLVGFWITLPWLYVAWILMWTIVLLPVSFWMFSKAATVTTLRRM
jgi:uncharacterized membrane protein YccF (DUF307 family)